MVIMNKKEMERIIRSLSARFVSAGERMENVVVVGLQRRGVALAQRLARVIEVEQGATVPVGTLDITLYRDDVSRMQSQPVLRSTDISFSIDDRVVLLVDDVLYTGRTVRAALTALLDLGRPKKIELLVLVDRNHRELPIQAEFVGKRVVVKPEQSVEVHLEEVDGIDEVALV